MPKNNNVDEKRRSALLRLGLTTAAIYSIPTITVLNSAAAAFPSHSNKPPYGHGHENGRGNKFGHHKNRNNGNEKY